MRRRTWIKRVRTLSLAMFIASVGLWGVSEFFRMGVMTSSAALAIEVGNVVVGYSPGRAGVFSQPVSWLYRVDFRGIHFPPTSCTPLIESTGVSNSPLIIGIPFWGTGLLAFGAWLFCTILLRRMSRLPNMCPNCGYDASRCTEGRCSECGKPVDSVRIMPPRT